MNPCFSDLISRRRTWLLTVIVLAGAVGAFAAVGASAEAPAAAADATSPTAFSTSPAIARSEVNEIDLDWVDVARHRDVPARLYWPAGVAATEKVPLVVFSHGLGGSRYGYSHLGRYWASQGYASLHVQHLGSDRAVWSSSFFSTFGNLQAAASEANAVARAKDVSFGITTVLADPRFGPHIDAEHIAVAGHSYGANTALLVAGATVQREVNGAWQPMSYRDPRVKAAIIMSAPPFYREGDMKTILSPVHIPTLHLTGTEDVIKIPGYRSDLSDRVAVFDATPDGPGAAKTLAVFSGGTHSIFTDRIDSAGVELNQVVKAATRELSLEFLNATLRGAPYQRVADWLSRRGDLLARKVIAAAP